jgi:glycosyltransferase involved in cell wall biosynthesis
VPALVSVIIPAWNVSPFVQSAIRSVLAQTYHEFEVLVVDDGSTDDTATSINAIRDARVRLIAQNHRGAAAARNRGLAEARGTFIQFLDADDLMGAEKIGRQMEVLGQAPAGSVASCAWAHYANDPRDAVVRPEPVWQVSNPVEWLTCSLSGGGMMQPGSWLTPRAVIEAAGPWDESLTLHDDGEFFTRVLLKATHNVFVTGATLYYREVAGSLSRARSRPAMESALAVCHSRQRHLLAAVDSPAGRRALATQYGQFAYEFGALAPDLNAQALREMHALGATPAPVIGGPSFRWLTRALGFPFAWRIRLVLATGAGEKSAGDRGSKVEDSRPGPLR